MEKKIKKWFLKINFCLDKNIKNSVKFFADFLKSYCEYGCLRSCFAKRNMVKKNALNMNREIRNIFVSMFSEPVL